MIDTRMGDYVRVQLPSGRSKDLPAQCRATIGVLGGHGRTEKPLLKAGAAHHRARARGKQYPTVRHFPAGRRKTTEACMVPTQQEV